MIIGKIITKMNINCDDSMYLIKISDKTKIKNYFPKFQSILMQVAKSGVVNKKTASRKISKISKRI